MSTHYITCAPIALLAGFLVVVSETFSAPTLQWVAMAVAIAVIVIAVLAQLDRGRGGVQRTLDVAIVAVAALLIVFALEASGTAVGWLSFAFDLGLVALAFAGLSLHEMSNWRAQHQLAGLRWLPNAEVAPRESRAA
jgi:hypothetical protein